MLTRRPRIDRRRRRRHSCREDEGRRRSAMPTVARALLASPLLPPSPSPSPPSPPLAFLPVVGRRLLHTDDRRRRLISACATSPHEPVVSGRASPPISKKLYLSNCIQEIEPLDVAIIQKDVPAYTIDAMKRTISSMLGLLPSDQFHVMIEAFWEPLSKLLVSSIMTGYTLRNAEYRLCLERNLDIHDDHMEKIKLDNHDNLVNRSTRSSCSGHTEEPPSLNMNVQGLGELSPEVLEYIRDLSDRLASARQELHEVKRKNAALQMQQFVGEDKNDLLDYLRSLNPEKVAELSAPTSDLQDIVNCVVHGLLATLSPRMHSKSSMQSDNLLHGDLNIDKEECTEIVESTSLNFHPLISVTRDYLARLLFWCMLLGHSEILNADLTSPKYLRYLMGKNPAVKVLSRLLSFLSQGRRKSLWFKEGSMRFDMSLASKGPSFLIKVALKQLLPDTLFSI